jgi:hypothetical protein
VHTVVVTVDATPGDEVLIGPYVAFFLADAACVNAIRTDSVLFLCERLKMTEPPPKNVGMHYVNFITLNTTRLPECDSNCNACCAFIFLIFIFVCSIYTCFLSVNCDVNMPSE